MVNVIQKTSQNFGKRYLLNNSVMIGHRFKRNDTKQRLLMSKFFWYFIEFFFSNIKDLVVLIYFVKQVFKKINPYLKFMIEGFWWGFIAICLKKNVKIYQIKINHRKELVVKQMFSFKKIPSIALRNILGLIKLRFINIIY